MKVFLAVVLFILPAVLSVPYDPVLSYAESMRSIAERVNSLQTTWRATPSSKRFEGVTENYVRSLCGALLRGGPILPVKEIEVPAVIPDTFDARQKWPDCPSIGTIRDQGACGSCWAFGAVEAMSDRYCISFQEQVNISAEDLLSCCKTCGNGCGGGYPTAAWKYWADKLFGGIVTGGQYDSNEGCQPYTIPKCNHHEPGPYKNCSKKSLTSHTPSCKRSCISGYDKSYHSDKHYGKSSYSISSNVSGIQTEIMTNGPVEASFDVYADFPTYTSGVYQHTTDHRVSSHAIKILGWGTENGVPYWLVANSWNLSWGDNGFFKILRGKNECGIESGIIAGMPEQYK